METRCWLAAGKFAGLVAEPLFHTEEGELFGGQADSLLSGHAADQQGQDGIEQHIVFGDELILLENEADLLIADLGQLASLAS